MAPVNQTWLVRISRFIAAEPWAQTVASLAVAAPLVSAVAVAVTGRQTAAAFGWAGLPGIVVAAWMVRSGGWELTRAERIILWDTRRSGRSSGDQHLDAIAAYQLQACSRAPTATKVLPAGVVLVGTAGPVIAALRTGSAWWLLELLGPVVLAVVLAPLLGGEPCADRLQRLTHGAPTVRPARRRYPRRPKGRSAL